MPNSILWIGLVVMWVFVLFPILADRHPRIRRTTDAALATRVLHRGGSKRRKGSGYARKKRSGRVHRKRHHGNEAEDRMTTTVEETVLEADEDPIAFADDPADENEITDEIEPAVADDDPELDDDEAPVAGTVEIPVAGTAAPATDSVTDTVPARIPPVRARRMPAVLDDDDQFVPTRRGRGGYDPEADAVARVARYTFRQRAVVALMLTSVLCGGLAVALTPLFWWGCAGAAVSLVAYLGYLRKQVRIEQEIRRRRSARLAERSPEPEEPTAGEPAAARSARPGMDRATARALRRRSHLLEPDDEDPIFEHLDAYDAGAARMVRHRASGGDIRRAAGA